MRERKRPAFFIRWKKMEKTRPEREVFSNKTAVFAKMFQKSSKTAIETKNRAESGEEKKNDGRRKLVLIKIQRRNKKEEKIKKLAR